MAIEISQALSRIRGHDAVFAAQLGAELADAPVGSTEWTAVNAKIVSEYQRLTQAGTRVASALFGPAPFSPAKAGCIAAANGPGFQDPERRGKGVDLVQNAIRSAIMEVA